MKSLAVIALVMSSAGVAIGVPSLPMAGAATTDVTRIDANVECTTIVPSLPFGVKSQSGAPGRYDLPGSGGGYALIGGNTTSKTIDWTANYPVDAVIVFGGASANVYRYSNATGDTGLVSPIKNGKLPDISHVWFCHDGIVDVTVDTKRNPADAAGVAEVDAARGVALGDIPFTALNVSDASVLTQVYQQLAGAPALKVSAALKVSPALKVSAPLKVSDTFRVAAPLKVSPALKVSAALKVSTLIRVIAALKVSAPLKVSPVDAAVLQTPLSSLVLDVVAPDGTTVTWARVLEGTVYEGWPLNSVTFADVAELIQDAQAASNPPVYPGGIGLIANVSLFQIDSSGAMIGRLSVLSLLLMNTPLAALSAATASGNPIEWCELSEKYTGGTGTCVVRDPLTGNLYPDATLLELALYGVPSTIVPVWDIDMAKLRTFFAAQPAPKAPLAYALTGDFDGSGSPEATPFCATAATLGNCLAEMISAKDFPWEDLPIAKLNLQQYALGERLPVNVNFGVGTIAPTVTVTLPTGFEYDRAAGTQACVFGSCNSIVPTSVVKNVAGLQVVTFGSGLPTGMVNLKLQAAPAGLLPDVAVPAKGTVSATVTYGATVRNASTAGPTVTDPWTTGIVPAIVPDTFYFGSLPENGVNPYNITLSSQQVGSWLSVRLTALTDGLDGDLALFSPTPPPALSAAAALKVSPVSGSSAQPVADPGDNATGNLAPETLQDVPTTPTDSDFPLLRQVSATRGDTDELSSIVDASSTAPTTYRVQVSAYGTTRGDYAIRVIATPSGVSACPAATFGGTIGAPSAVTGVTDPTGLIVYNTAATNAALLGANGDTGSTLYGLAKSTNSLLLPVTPTANDLWTTPQAGTQFDCAPVTANAVVQAISDDIRSLKAGALSSLNNVVIVGGDDRLPFYRSPDTTTLANESEHSGEVGTDNPISASQRNRFFLSDDPYGTLNPVPWLDRTFNVPELAVGRLVESDTEIRDQIALYQANSGNLNPTSALVTGYDFLNDAGIAIDQKLRNGGLATTSLLDPIGIPGTQAWTAQQVRDALAAGPDVASVNSHFSQYALLSSQGDRRGTYDVLDLEPNDPANTNDTSVDFSTIPDTVLRGTILFSAGCHAGMTVPDAYATNNGTYPLLDGFDAGIPYDWAQAFASRSAAVWVANTGYGYGSAADTVLSERLMALYSKYLMDPTTTGAGDALVKAKREYFLSQGVYGSYDEKALQQVVFYGIPSFRFSSVGGVSQSVRAANYVAPPTSTIQPQAAPLGSGLPASTSITKDFSQTLTPRTINDRKAWTVNGETLALNGYPIVPRTSIDVTSVTPGLTARGAFIETMETTTELGVLPDIARSTVDRSSTEPAAQAATVVFPTAFQAVTSNGGQQRLVVYPGQFSDLNPIPGQDRGSQLLIQQSDYTVYYADATNGTDVVRPFIQESTASADALGDGRSVVLFRVKVEDPSDFAQATPTTGIRRVLVQYDDQPNANTRHPWVPVELRPDTKGDWVGSLVTTKTDGRYFVQALDGAGNSAISQLKGDYFFADGTSPQAVAVVTEGTLSGTGWYITPVKVNLYVAGKPATAADGYSYEFDGADRGIYSGPFDTPEGVTDITFTPPSNLIAAPPVLQVKKDTGTPVATLSPALAIVAAGTAIPTTTCTATDTTSAAVCEPLDPTVVTVDGVVYTLARAQARDEADNVSPVASQTAVIIDGDYDPVTQTASAATGITVVAGGALYQGVTFKVGVDGVPQTGTLDNAALTNTLSITAAGSYPVEIAVPGSGGSVNVVINITVIVSDVTPPVITVPATKPTAEATGPDGAVVTYTATAVDDTNGVDITFSCLPASGSTFPVGVSNVLCTATDRATPPNTSTRSFQVEVTDTTAPIVTVPTVFAVTEATSAAGAVVGYSGSVSATDIVDGAITPDCAPASGSMFAVGETTVICTARDVKGNVGSDTFTVRVVDTTAPTITNVPANIVIEGNTSGGANVEYVTPTATDLVFGTVPVTCSPAAPSVFPVGTTTVNCSAVDSVSPTPNSASVNFTVTVVDTTAPIVTVPANQLLVGTSPSGAAYSFNATATDIVSGARPVSCSPPSGTVFGYTTTTVVCTAADASGNSASASFTVAVVVARTYNGFFSPVNMGVLDGYRLSGVVNTVNGGRNVPLKWEVFNNVTGVKETDLSKVTVGITKYSAFANLPANAPLGLPKAVGAGCAGKPEIPVSGSTTGKTTTVRLSSGQFNVGLQMPAKPTSGENCWVVWTKFGTDLPGIMAMFKMT